MNTKNSIIETLPVDFSADYELLDSGEEEKLERFGSVVLARPDPQALWRKSRSAAEWKKADGTFTREGRDGSWNMNEKIADKMSEGRWQISFADLKFWIKPTAFKHTGLFPEQAMNWDWMRRIIEGEGGAAKNIQVLNLFGYTGGATLACAQAGAKVVHVDGSKSAITWARENAEISELADKPIRWILEDARAFVERELKRGNKYDAIIMDPPSFGHGPNKELWKIEKDFLPLIELCAQILTDKPLFFIVNGYSAGYSAVAYRNVLLSLVEKYGGSIEIGELTIAEAGKKSDKGGKVLPCGIFARWSR